MLGIIFSNIYDSALGELTRNRTVASLPFGGRYRLVDFVLSNMVNSNITKIGLITKYNYRSLMDHLGSCEEWDLNRKNGGLCILPPFSSGNTGLYRGKLEALHVALSFLESSNEEYVLLSDCLSICNIDYRPALASHIKSGCDVTVIANRDADSDLQSNLVMHADDSGNVTDIALHYPADSSSWQGMGMFLLSRELLLAAVKKSNAHGVYHFERDFLQKDFNEGLLRIHVFPFHGITLRNAGIPAYFNNNLRLCEAEVRHGIFLPHAPIYTKVRDEIPSFYGTQSHVTDCIIADGCHVDGDISDSVLFRDVSIASRSTVRKSILMQDVTVGHDVHLAYVIADKASRITDGTILIGSASHPIIINKEEEI